MKKRKRMQRVMAFILALMLGLSALGGVMVAFASETPNINLDVTNEVEVRSGTTTNLYFNDLQGNKITADFYDNYHLELIIMRGDEYFETFEILKDDSGVYYLAVKPASRYEAGTNTKLAQITFGIKCYHTESNQQMLYTTAILKPLLFEIVYDDYIYYDDVYMFDESVSHATIELDDNVTIEIPVATDTHYNFAFFENINPQTEELEVEYDANPLERFEFSPSAPDVESAKITIRTNSPYLYILNSNNSLTEIETQYHDQTHVFFTNKLGGFYYSYKSIF